MVLVKSRKYHNLVGTNLASLVGPSATPLSLLVDTAPISFVTSFLRARAELGLTVRVLPTLPPSPDWWTDVAMYLIAWWSPNGSVVSGSGSGTSEHYLGSQLLHPTLVTPTGAGAEYFVRWEQTEPFEVVTARKNPAATSPPTFILGLVVYDPFSNLDGSNPGVSISYFGRGFTLWGSPP